jgi:hypothetical protein
MHRALMEEGRRGSRPLVDGGTGTSWRARAEEDKPDDEMYGISVTGKC